MKKSLTFLFLILSALAACALTGPPWSMIEIGVSSLTQTNINVATGTILVKSNLAVASSITVPATQTIWFDGVGKLTVATGATVTINGPVIAEARQVFAGSGTVYAFGNREVAPEWWGCAADWNGSTGTDNTPGLEACMAGVASDGVTIQFGPGCYQFASSVDVPLINASQTKPISLVGVSPRHGWSTATDIYGGSTRFLYRGGDSTTFLNFRSGGDGSTNANTHLKDLSIYGTEGTVATGTRGIYFGGLINSEINNILVMRFQDGIEVTGYSFYSFIDKVQAIYNTRYGLYGNVSQFNGTRIERSNFSNNGTGVYGYYSLGMHFDGCWIENNATYGIQLESSAYASMDKCYFEGAPSEAHILFNETVFKVGYLHISDSTFTPTNFSPTIHMYATGAVPLTVTGTRFAFDTFVSATTTAILFSNGLYAPQCSVVGCGMSASATYMPTWGSTQNLVSVIGSSKYNQSLASYQASPTTRLTSNSEILLTNTRSIRFSSEGMYHFHDAAAQDFDFDIYNPDVTLGDGIIRFGRNTTATNTLRTYFYDGSGAAGEVIDHKTGRIDAVGGVNVATTAIDANKIATLTGLIRFNSTSKKFQGHDGDTGWVDFH